MVLVWVEGALRAVVGCNSPKRRFRKRLALAGVKVGKAPAAGHFQSCNGLGRRRIRIRIREGEEGGGEGREKGREKRRREKRERKEGEKGRVHMLFRVP